jgi:hypothetical protein
MTRELAGCRPYFANDRGARPTLAGCPQFARSFHVIGMLSFLHGARAGRPTVHRIPTFDECLLALYLQCFVKKPERQHDKRQGISGGPF